MDIHFSDRKIVIPQSWNALTLGNQFAAFSRIMTDDGCNLVMKRHVLMQLLTGITDAELDDLEGFCIERKGAAGKAHFTSILRDLYTCTDFLFDIVGNGNMAIKADLTRCPFPKLTGATEPLFAPSDGFDNVQFGELATLFDLYEQHTATEDPSVVHEILATIYRPSKADTPENVAMAFEGDRRQPLLRYEATVENRIPLFVAMPEAMKAFLMFWVGSCLAQIVKRNKRLFQNNQATYTKSYGWAGVMLKLANGVVNLDAVAAQPYQNVLTHLNMLEDERIEQERQLNQ